MIKGHGTDRHLLYHSFDAIRHLQIQLGLLNHEDATATAISRRIELCERLLDEIVGIRTNLARYIGHTRASAHSATCKLLN